jgi:iron complex transport system ATP-binding protein
VNVTLKDLSCVVGGRLVLDRVTATFEAGALTCLLGANGAGKSTLLRILLGELKPSSGAVSLGEADLTGAGQKQLARHFATVPQRVASPPYLTVAELVSLGRFRPGGRFWRGLDEADRRVVRASIQQCEIERLADRRVEELSGGEQQRAWVAFCLAQQKPFVLLDETLDSLDVLARRDFFALVAGVAAGGAGVVLTTHDLGLAREFADRLVVLSGGGVAYDGPPTGEVSLGRQPVR